MSHNTTSAPLIVRCTSNEQIHAVIAEHGRNQVAVVACGDIVDGRDRAWWPLIDQCSDHRVASVVADHLTRDLPPSLQHYTPEAATLLAGALHAASLVGWPIITLTHILDSSAVATIIELLSAQDTEFALDVAAVAGASTPETGRVVAAAAIGAQQLHHSEALICGPTMGAAGTVLAGAQRPIVAVLDDGSTVADLVLSRLRFMSTQTAGEAA